MTGRNTRAGLAVLVAMCGLASTAAAQNALDNNLQVGAGRANAQRPDFRAEVQFRNAIITGNAPGGISFRGDVGYRAPGEFMGNLGSNSQFAFRRDSIYSGLGGQGIRGTDALQFQAALTTGNAPPSNLAGFSGVVYRGGRGATAAQVLNNTIGDRPDGLPSAARPRAIEDDAGFTNRRLDLLAVRSPSAYVAGRTLQPTLLGVTQDKSGQTIGINASVLRGITFDQMSVAPQNAEQKPDQRVTPGVPDTGAPKLPSERETTPRTTEAANPAQSSQITGGATPTRADNRIESTAASVRTSYDEVMDRLRQGEQGQTGATGTTGATGATGTVPSGAPAATGAAGVPGELPEWRRRLEELREQLSDRQGVMASRTQQGAKPATGMPGSTGILAATGPLGLTGATGATGVGGATGGTSRVPGTTTPRAGAPRGERGATGSTDDVPRGIGPSPATLEMLKRGGEVGILAPPSFDAYGTNMAAGQKDLAAGRFFDAEERFVVALSAKPDDPMAAIGRVHAELGSAMFMSAAINLRSLFVEHPELIGVKFAPELLPSKERVAKIIDRLGELAGEADGRGRDQALLLAYLGYQTGNEQALQHGLKVMSAVPQGGQPDQLTRLSEVLRGVWTKPDALKPAEPKPAPTSTPPTPPGNK